MEAQQARMAHRAEQPVVDMPDTAHPSLEAPKRQRSDQVMEARKPTAAPAAEQPSLPGFLTGDSPTDAPPARRRGRPPKASSNPNGISVMGEEDDIVESNASVRL